jgi:predicted amidophosphoribosyltransferase
MERKTCPSCGAAIEAERAGGLCPACLLNEGLRAEGTTAGPRLRCPACQSTLGEDARFCARCGTPAPAEPAAQGDRVRTALEGKLQRSTASSGCWAGAAWGRSTWSAISRSTARSPSSCASRS